jgi:uncharacterized NAD(P)/FAD-binding protein YdhS
MPHVCIVGAGFSGTLVAIQLLRQWRGAGLRVTVLDRSGRFGPGLAYSTTCPQHLLNVRAGRMSAFADRPDDFLVWARSRSLDTHADSFLPRALYGEYLQARLREARDDRGEQVELIAAEAVDVVNAPSGGGWLVKLAGGGVLAADGVVFALGNYPPADLPVRAPAFTGSERCIRDPWDAGALKRVDPQARVLLIGTGLTMVDVVLQLEHQGHAGPMEAVSRHGLLPRSQTPASSAAAVGLSSTLSARGGTLGLLRGLRAAARRGDWRATMEAVRPVTPALWRGLDERERGRFLRHARPYWDVHRHGMPPAVAERIAGLKENGRLVIRAGRVRELRRHETGVEVTLQPRGEETCRRLTVDWVVNCTGPCSDVQRVRDPLMTRLLCGGFVAPDPLGLGVTLPPRNDAAAPAARTYWIGPLRKAELWETTAVPELRVHAGELAKELIQDLQSDGALRTPRSESIEELSR